VAAGTGCPGWSFGVPFGPRTPDAHASSRSGSPAARRRRRPASGRPALFFTDDDGCYCTRTRDVQPDRLRAVTRRAAALERVLEVCRDHTIRIREGRLDLPSAPPHVLPPNLWWANKPGIDALHAGGRRQRGGLGLMALMIRHGVMVVDHDTGEPAGDLEPFVRSGLLDPAKRLPLAELQATSTSASASSSRSWVTTSSGHAGDGAGRPLLQRDGQR
jgi:hypothetical protein